MTVRELSRYRQNAEKIDCINRQDARWGTVTVFGQGKVQAQAEVERLRAENKAIKDFIASIPDDKVYRALMLYCVIGHRKTWDEVALSMGERSGDTISKRVRRILNIK